MKTMQYLLSAQILFCSFGHAQQAQTQLKNFSKNDLQSLVTLGQSGVPMNEQYKMLTVHMGNPGIYHTIIIGKTPAGYSLFNIRLEDIPTIDPNKTGPSSLELQGQYAGVRKVWDFGISYDGELKTATVNEWISSLDKQGNETRTQLKEGQPKDINSPEAASEWMQAKTFWLGQAKTAKSRAALLNNTFFKWLKTPAGEEYVKSFIKSPK